MWHIFRYFCTCMFTSTQTNGIPTVTRSPITSLGNLILSCWNIGIGVPTGNRTQNRSLEGYCYIRLTISTIVHKQLTVKNTCGLEPAVGVEPTTYWLLISCSANWTTLALELKDGIAPSSAEYETAVLLLNYSSKSQSWRAWAPLSSIEAVVLITRGLRSSMVALSL